MNISFPVVSVTACCKIAPGLRASGVSTGLLAGLLLASTSFAVTITGRVFVDQNADGAAAPSEPGVAGVAVSDGRSVVQTSDNGVYTIEVADAPFVFISLPRGYRAVDSFYADARAGGRMDFALADWPESRRDEVRFAQISDTHVDGTDEAVRTFIEDIEEINALDPKPAFVLATGDLVNMGNQATQFEGYLAGIEHFTLPLFNLPGNHDVKDSEGLEHYHRNLGPDYYSFNVGNCHFILINGVRNADDVRREEVKNPAPGEPPLGWQSPGIAQHAWIEQDLAAAPKGSTLIVATHYLPSPEMTRYFSALGAKAVLSGHWHGHRVSGSHGIADLNTPPLRFGGIDRHPRSFRVVEVAAGRVRNELRLGGFRRHAVVVAPAGALTPAGEKLPVLVNAYDTRANIESVHVEIGDRRIALRKTSDWSWAGEAPVDAGATGPQTAVAAIRAVNGETWQAKSTFHLQPAQPRLRLKWVAPTGGFIAVSSPRITRSGIAIGVDDAGLDQCGVAAFDFAGKKRWHFNTDSGIKNHIAVAGGRLFATSVAGWLYALDEHSGKLLWKAALDRKQTRWEIAATTVKDGVVHVGSAGYVAAFEAESGKRLWETRLTSKGDWTPTSYTVPIITRGKVLLPNLRYGLFALDTRTGETVWRHGGKFSGCAVDGDTLYTLRNGLMVAIAVDTGKVVWSGAEKIDGTASMPVVAGDRVVIGSADGRVCALSTKDGSLLWSYQTGLSLTSLQPYKRGGSDVNSSPVVHDNIVYVGASDGSLYALALTDGTKLATYSLGAPIASTPVIADGTLYTGGYDGNLHALSIRQ